MIALLDGDVLCYQACTSRWKKKVLVDLFFEDGKVVEENTRLITLTNDGKKEVLEFTKEEDEEYLEECKKNFRRQLKEILETLWVDSYLMAVKGEDNFRDLLFPEYKINRHKDVNHQNLFVPILRDFAVKEFGAIYAHGREADDLLRIWSEECKSIDRDYVVVSIDKDLRCIPGKHCILAHGTPKAMVPLKQIEVSEEDGMRLFYGQILQGDPTDNIPGIPGLGPKTAIKLLNPCENEEEMQFVVVDQYMRAYGDEWHNWFLSNAKMVYLQKHSSDYFCAMDWPIIKELL